MEKNKSGGNPANGSFQKAVALLGISPDKISKEQLHTSAAAKALSDDAGKSLIKPVKIVFESSKHGDEFWAFANSDNTDKPAEITTFTADNVVVTPNAPLIIKPSGKEPVVVNIDTLTMEPGGQIQCLTSVILNVTTFIKQ
ncbi:hypothetical protein [Mucilaginibacter sp. SP1R1]|uniref:hypothetical protein n=1 Tax=Mucilaginibacter sp. SP1R1 TaxID=2723091 RepID=UPI00161FB24D|nr:hypothetical protein [Mucilaginibacter sp. SP1R1]MBB6148791.1 hypothetical protein [Mucilaginibacter sp. SP1R1]